MLRDDCSYLYLRYNPEHDLESRLLRHRAVALQDLAHSIFDHELSEEFEKVCSVILIINVYLRTRAETNTCTIRLFDRFDSIRMLLQLFEYSFEVF